MIDIWKRDPQLPPTASSNDEDIIELVEEIGEESPEPHPLSPLEKNLLDLGNKDNMPGSAVDELPDIADLGRIDFEEEEEERPTAALNDIEEISEFDEQFLEAEDLLEGLPAPPEETASGEDEDVELLEIDEEDDADDEIVWFDDLDKPEQEAAEVEPAPEADSPQASILGLETEALQAASAADLFAAPVQSTPAEADSGIHPAAAAAEAGAPLAAAAEAAVLQTPVESPPGGPPTAAADLSAAAVSSLAPEEIEAAVERVIDRKLGGTIEAIILQAIEKAVSKEIERLKSLLLEDEAGDRTP
jgi:hypothetical protein